MKQYMIGVFLLFFPLIAFAQEESDFATTIATYDDYNFFISDLVPPFIFEGKRIGAYFFVSSYDKLRAPYDYYFVLIFFQRITIL